MSFGESGAEQQATQYQQKYTGQLDQSMGYGQSLIDSGLGMFNQLNNQQNSTLGGQNFLSQYSSQLGGLETSNSTMKSIADRLANFDVGSLNQGAVENLALQNQAGDSQFSADLASRGLSGNGGIGLQALTSLRGTNQKTYADALRQNQLAGVQSLGQAGQIMGQVGNNQQGLLSLLGNLDLSKAQVGQQGLSSLLGLGGSIYGNALQGQGNLNGQMQQAGMANAQGRGSLTGGLLQGGLGLIGTVLGGPIGGALGGLIGGAFGGKKP